MARHVSSVCARLSRAFSLSVEYSSTELRAVAPNRLTSNLTCRLLSLKIGVRRPWNRFAHKETRSLSTDSTFTVVSDGNSTMAAEPFPYSTMVELLHYWSSHDAHRPAFVFYDKYRKRYELTRGQLYQLGGRWAAVLQEGGVGRGERVVSTLPNGPERALCDVGIVMAGAVVVNAQCQLADGSDLLLVLRQSKACAACVDPDRDFGPWHVLKQHGELDPDTGTFSSDSLPDLQKVFFIRRSAPLCQDDAMASNSQTGGDHEAQSQFGEGETQLIKKFGSPETGDLVATLQTLNAFYKSDVAAEETFIIFTTSGSTGFSKLVPHTHACFMKFIFSLKTSSIDEFSTVFNSSPLGWLGGSIYIPLALGKGRLIMDMWNGAPDDMAALVWDIIVQEKCPVGVIMPFLLPKILSLKDSGVWKMMHIALAGQPIKASMVRQALQLAHSVGVGYASTELISVSNIVVLDVSHFCDFFVGKPLPSSTVKVCDSDGKEVPRTTRGEIYAKTHFMVKAYFNNEEDTAASFTADGFLKTGDIGVMLEDGSLLVEGRQHDAIHRGNYIFYPAWLESRIIECCPGLQDVFVVGVPDPAMGEEICACFVPSDPSVTEERVRSLVEKDILAKVEDPLSPRPRYYLRFQAFPKTYTDKPLRKDVRRQAIERLNLA